MSLVAVKNTNTMSSTQLGKDKKEVNRQIREMFADKIEGGDSPPSITATLDARGYVLDYHLPELESNMFAAKLMNHQNAECEALGTKLMLDEMSKHAECEVVA